MANLVKKIYTLYGEALTAQEDAPALFFLDSLPTTNQEYLEVASGLGRFPLLLSKNKPNLRITCVDINRDLTKDLEAAGIPLLVGDILKTNLGEGVYDIVHCSHIIEHFGYPDITCVLDKVLRGVKTGGYVILRSPLLYPGFYKEIDHIRPYPPESIFNYYNNPQQQKIGRHRVKEVSRWYRREALQLQPGGRLSFYANLLLKLSWMLFRFPHSRRTGYVLILQKL